MLAETDTREYVAVLCLPPSLNFPGSFIVQCPSPFLYIIFDGGTHIHVRNIYLFPGRTSTTITVFSSILHVGVGHAFHTELSSTPHQEVSPLGFGHVGK
jgi:hypothetical protein